MMEFLKNDLLGLSSGQTDSAPAKESGAAASADGQTASEAPAVQIRIYRFGSLDQVTDAARIVNGICEGKNSLYKRPQTSTLLSGSLQRGLRSPDLQPSLQYSCRVWRKGKPEAATEAYYQEHYEIIIRNQALQKLALVNG